MIKRDQYIKAMQKHILIIKQIEVSKKLIDEDTTQALRIALLLLDHTIEILMYRYIDWEILRGYPRSDEMPFYFPEKVKLLVEKDAIEKDIGDFVNFSHRYRNEVYHQDKLKKETIKPLVLVLFKVVCELFSKLELGGIEYKDNFEEDLKEYQGKYNLPSMEKLEQDTFIKIVEKISGDVSISTKDIKSLLIAHLESRIRDAKRDVLFVSKENKEWKDIFSDDLVVSKILSLNLTPRLDRWSQSIKDIDRAEEEIKIFNLFMKLELEVEKTENNVNPAVEIIADYEDMMYEAWKERDI